MYIIMNFLFVNFVIVDLLIFIWCLLGMVFLYIIQLSGQLGIFFCKFIIIYRIVGIGMIVFGLILILIFVEWYKVFVILMVMCFWFSKGNVFYVIVGIWVFVVVYVCLLFVFEMYNEEIQECIIFWFLKDSVYWIIFVVIVIIVFVIMFVCYFSIIKGLYFINIICLFNVNVGG